jgi:hypothetical protein
MRALVIALVSILAAPHQVATGTESVAITEEPHHKLLLENSYVRIFHANVPVHEATLLHRHELPYVTVSLANNDFINAIVGKPEAEVVQKDRQINYSEGGFAHSIRPRKDSAFNNITVELLHPQGTARNDCEKVVDGPLGDCKSGPDSPLKALLKLVSSKPAFTTDDIFVSTVSLANGVNYLATAAHTPQLLIACSRSEFKLDMPGQAANVLHEGEILWVPPGATAKVTSAVAQGTSAIVTVTFKAAEKK